MYMLKDPTNPTWEKIDILKSRINPRKRSYHSACFANDNLYIIGGKDKDRIYDDIHCFNIISKKWNVVQIKNGLLYPLFGQTSLTINYIDPVSGRPGAFIVVEGGKSEDNNCNGLMIYDVEHNMIENVIIPSNPPFRCLHGAVLVEV